MNKTKIEWVADIKNGIKGYTWNPFTGCLNNCEYCYARKIALRFNGNFNPEFHSERLNQPLKVKEPSRIFVGSMGEIGYMDKDWIRQVIEVCNQCPQHTFLFLSNYRNQDYILDTFPDNCWFGITITDGNLFDYGFLMDNNIEKKHFISFEPLQGKIEHLEHIKEWDWVIIGAETRNGYTVNDHAPKKEWIEEIVEECGKYDIPIFLKNNLREICGDKLIQEIPTIKRGL